ncbi:septum formation initiator family protein [Bacterioplanoides sp. SCSIO 12839]|uniref:FtsB family cell division protein n=1 Tax=Bacterioplanoides sp. SCSIO 12839 TaxID=2829569 RepID=UPI0021055D97|nr:septum formation initiator family protein [Bacterioplanoides sp. SCSIO 12839]UTW47657.1 septum formation initiator family protein [Bacterioplanoides sp. SCSIO 12839]
MRWLIYTLIPAALLLILLYRLWFDDTGLVASNELQQKIEQLQQDNEVQQNQNRALMAEVRDLKTGNEILEEKAREDLGLIREGETFILFVDPAKK